MSTLNAKRAGHRVETSPEDHDPGCQRFALGDAATQADTDVFANIDAAVAALQTPVTPGAGAANLTNAIVTAMDKLANTLNNVITVQASVGGRENEVQLQSVTQSNNLQTQSNLADLTQVISKYTMVQFSLQAAQQGFSMIQKMSLFNYTGN